MFYLSNPSILPYRLIGSISDTVPPGMYFGQSLYLIVEQRYKNALFLNLLTWGFITQKDSQVLCRRAGQFVQMLSWVLSVRRFPGFHHYF